MIKDRPRIERQLSLAKQELSACESKLAAAGVTGKELKKNAVWRHLNAEFRQLKRRLLAVAAVEEREAAVVQRRAEKENAQETVEA